jgi:hypothetical protein
MRTLAILLLWSATASANPCTSHCGWPDELIISFMGSALVAEHVAIPATTTNGTAFNATSSAPYHAELAPDSQRSMWTLGFRTGVLWRGPTLIAGVELAYGASLGGPTTVATVEGNPPITNRGGQLYDFASVVGAHHRVGRLDFGGMLVLGARVIGEYATFPSGFSTCAGGEMGKGCTPYLQTFQGLVETRGRIDWWVGRHVTLGVTAGFDFAHQGESLALELELHLLPYDGT